MLFEKVKAEYDAKGQRSLVTAGEPDIHMECDDVLVAVGQEKAFPWIEKDIGIEFDRWEMPKVNPTTMQSTHSKVFFGGDSAFGPKNIIWEVAHGHEAAVSIDLTHDEADLQRKLTLPVLVLWGEHSHVNRSYRPLEAWRERALDVRGKMLACGHYPAEQAPDDTYAELRAFFL